MDQSERRVWKRRVRAIAFCSALGPLFLYGLLAPVYTCGPASPQTIGISHVKQVNFGLAMYLDDNEAYPLKAKELKPSVMPYIKNPEVFDSRNGTHIAFNRSLEGATLLELEAGTDTVNLIGRVMKSPGRTVIGRVDSSVISVRNDGLWELRWRLRE